MHWRSIAAASLLLAAVIGSLYAFWPRPAPPLVVIPPTPRPTSSPAPAMFVHVVGAVASPGVYRVPAGARAEDAIEMAGGLTEDADAASLNLAARLVDGQQLSVKGKAPSNADRSSAPGEAKPAGKLNLNAASVADLDALPGLGPALAQRIVERRQRLGPYQSIEQLRDEKILPPATYDRVRDLVTVN